MFRPTAVLRACRSQWRCSPVRFAPSRLVCRSHSASASTMPAVVTTVNDSSVHRVGYITDVEGNLDYFTSCVYASDVLDFDSTLARLELQPNACFVFGGDCFDKGVGDHLIARMLVDLKVRHPDRVFLLLGNRDLNKMKLTSELHASDIDDRDVDDIPGPYWVPRDHSFHVTLRQFLCKQLGVSSEEEVAKMDARLLNTAHTRVTRLQYMYQHQMGCLHTFEHRRRAIAVARGCLESAVSDTDVVEDVLAGVSHGGAVHEYLRHGQIGVVIGDTAFVHGGITRENMGFVPARVNHDRLALGPSPGYETLGSKCVQEWIEDLNAYSTQGVAEWVERPLWSSNRGRRGGDILMGYGYKRAMAGRTVVTQSYMDSQQHPRLPREDVVEYLNNSGIHRVMCGHQPFGDSPHVMRIPGKLDVIMADTSFSDTSKGDPLDTRGVAHHAVTLHNPCGDAGTSQVSITGKLADGSALDFVLPPPAASAPDTPEALLGRHTEDEWWVKALLSQPGPGGEPRYLLSKGEGHTVHYETEPHAVVSAMLEHEA